MSKDMVVKSNRLNMAIQALSLPEIRIIQLAIIDARETGKGLDTNTPLRIDAMRYAEAFDTSRQNAYVRMKETEETLFNRRFSFTDYDGRPVKSRWVQDVRYLDNEGAIEISFTRAVVESITRLDGAEQFFTQYLLSQTSKLNSVYSVRLYELLIQWKKARATPFIDLETFRGQMGLAEGEYKTMSNFKARVLDVAVNEINEKTDISVAYYQHKQGRIVTAFKFAVNEKTPLKDVPKYAQNSLKTLENKQRDKDTVDMFAQMTDKQIAVFSAKLAQMSELGSKAPIGASVDEFAQIIANDLRNSEKQAFYKPYLAKLGFRTSPSETK